MGDQGQSSDSTTPQKCGRGTPPKNAAGVRAMDDQGQSSDSTTPQKCGCGRPPKKAAGVGAKADQGQSSNSTTPQKSGPGRPRKNVPGVGAKADQRQSSNSKRPQKHGRGRRRKNVPVNSRGPVVDFSQYEDLFRALYKGDWDSTKEFLLGRMDAAVNERISPTGETALHVAVRTGHDQLIGKLVELLSEEDLEIKDDDGWTPMLLAARYGYIGMAKCMHEKNQKLVNIVSLVGEGDQKRDTIPVVMAMTIGNIEVARYLYSVTCRELLKPEQGKHGSTLIAASIWVDVFDVALDLLRHCPDLALHPNQDELTPLHALAGKPFAFPSGSQLVFWKRWIYDCIPTPSAHSTGEVQVIEIDKPNEQPSDQEKIIRSSTSPLRTKLPSFGFLLRRGLLHQLTEKEEKGIPTPSAHSTGEVQVIEIDTPNEQPIRRGLLHQLINSKLSRLLGIRQIYEMKVLHVQALELLHKMCEKIPILSRSEEITDALFRAAEGGIVEFVVAVVKANPDLVSSVNRPEGRNLFSCAIIHRQAKVFNLIYGIGSKSLILHRLADNSGNTMLHMPGILPTSKQLGRVTGAALQMQTELQWFKEVEKILSPEFKTFINDSYETPTELFTNSHKEMKKEGEEWMKTTATSCTVVGALIITIMFAAAFTVPGGNDQNTGFPIFSDKKLFTIFIVSDALSLFSSSTSVLTFLAILTSRYEEEDFLKSLPTKMIVGLATLFISIATMMITFSTALFLMQPRRSWMVIPVICLAGVSISIFAVMQFPLLLDMIMSTCGPSIFTRKIEPWVFVSSVGT